LLKFFIPYIEKWHNWKSKSVKRFIFCSAFIVSFLTGIVYVFHGLKDIYCASIFGTSDIFESFILAYSIPAFIINLLAGSISSAFIPVYLDVKSKTDDMSASGLFNNFLISVLLMLIILSAPLYFGGNYFIHFIASSYPPDKLNSAIKFYNFLLVLISLQVLIQLFSALLNASNRFILSAITPLIPSIIIILLLFIANKILNIYAIIYGLILGGIIQLIFLIYRAYKKNIFSLKNFAFHPKFLHIWKNYAPLLAGSFFASGTITVDQVMAATLPAKSLAALTYGDRIVSAVTTLLITGLGTVILPVFSRLIAMDEMANLKKTLWFYVKLTMLAGALISVFFIFFSDEIVRLFWERGAFTVNDTALVSKIQLIYSLKIPFVLAIIIIARAMSALGFNHYITIIATINMCANIILNYILMKFFDVAGIAASTVLVHIISFSLILLSAKKITSHQAKDYKPKSKTI
jgi:putative peptidoglycan lipid II flippase